MIEDLKKTIDIELKAYHEITDKRGKIIKDANKEAEDIIVEAEESASRIRMSKPNPLYVQRQVKDLNKKDKMALRTANEYYAASIIYTNEMLIEINESVRQAYNMLSEETDRVLDSLRQKSDVIEQNKRELMDGLLDMKKQERYADILEISQLLANELYYEKNRFEEEEQKTKKQAEENEMVQWEFDFEDKKEDPIKVKPSRQPVKLHDDILHDEVVDSAFEIADELKEEKKKDPGATLLGISTLLFAIAMISCPFAVRLLVSACTNLFLSFLHPIFLVLLCPGLTRIHLSSCASGGILKALSPTGPGT